MTSVSAVSFLFHLEDGMVELHLPPMRRLVKPDGRAWVDMLARQNDQVSLFVVGVIKDSSSRVDAGLIEEW